MEIAPLLLLLAGAPLGAQQVRGLVLDAASGPLAGAAVHFRAARGSDSLTVETDSLGSFAVVLPAPGGWLLTTTRMGYGAEGPSSISVGEGQELEVLIRLGAQALRLPPLEVRGVRQVLTGREEIYRRIAKAREQGIGRALTRAQLDQLNPHSVGAALSSMTSQVRTVESPQLMVNTVFLRGGPRGMCPPAVFIDGFQVNHRPTNVDLLIEPRHVEAIELFTAGAQAPIGFHDPGGCGSVLIWSRRGSPREGTPHTWRRYLVAGALVVGALVLWR